MKKDIGIPVEKVLEMDVMAGTHILAGKDGLSRMVTSVNVMEVPDIVDWVSSGELLVTTAHSIKDNIEVLRDVIPRLNALGVAGLGIKLKRYIDEIPPVVLDIADRLSFPLLEIPTRVAFPEIISSVLTVLVNKQTKVLMEIQDLHRALTSTMLSGGDLQEICNILHYRFGNSVAISSDTFFSYVVSTSDEKFPLICDILEQEKRNTPLGPPGPRIGAYRLPGSQMGKETYSRIVAPIYSDNILYGNIYMWEDSRDISGVELSVIESVTSLIALNIVKRATILDMENSHKASFVEDLLSGDRKRLQRASQNAAYYNINTKAGHLVVNICIRNAGEAGGTVGSVLYKLNNNIATVLQRLAKNAPVNFLFVSQRDSIVLVCEAPRPGEEVSRPNMELFLGELTGRLQSENLLDLVLVGVGRSYLSLASLYKSMNEAARAVSCPQCAKNGVVFFEDMGVYRLLSFEGQRSELALFHDEMLHPLLEYDYEKDADLIGTLQAYFKCKGNLTRMAEELDVHYNTVVYRMQRIRELSSQNLDTDEELLNLQVALKIYQMKHYE